METVTSEIGANWAAVTPYILARQEDIARGAARSAGAQSVEAQRLTNLAENLRARRAERSPDKALNIEAQERDADRAKGPEPSSVNETRSAASTEAKEPETDANGLTEAEQDQVADLRARDREVRNHEQAHARVGGEFAGEPTYSYQTGPDGRRYAIGGAVAIDVSPVRDDPMATILKMEVVKRAALAPAEPSSADRQVAAIADARRAQAVADLASLRAADRTPDVDRRA